MRNFYNCTTLLFRPPPSYSLPFPSFLFFFFPPLLSLFSLPFPLLRSRIPFIQLGDLGERCKLSKRDLGRSPSRNRIWCILALKFYKNFYDFPDIIWPQWLVIIYWSIFIYICPWVLCTIANCTSLASCQSVTVSSICSDSDLCHRRRSHWRQPTWTNMTQNIHWRHKSSMWTVLLTNC